MQLSIFINKIKARGITGCLFSLYCIIKRSISIVVYATMRLLPIDEHLVVFESEGDFCDNSWAFYNFLHQNYPDYYFVWLCHSKETIFKHGNRHPRTRFVYAHYDRISLAGFKALSQAKFVFFTHGVTTIAKRREGQTVFNLWHGIALKGKKGDFPAMDTFYNYATCLGDQNIASQAKFLNCRKEIVFPLGYPRNDIMLKNLTEGYKNPFIPSGFMGKVILWMPTFRASVNKTLSETEVDTETGLPLLYSVSSLFTFNEILKQTNVHVIVKIHHLQAEKDVFKMFFSNISFVTDRFLESKGLQLYEIVGKSDALLSDYSSVAVDYLLTDKPMGFILDDFESYANSRGAYMFDNVKELMAGAHIYNLEELYKFVEEIASGIDNAKDIRQRVKNLMIKYTDTNSCKRIAEFCGF